MDDDLTFLASAYLDGDLTADERARVEAEPEAAAEVERLRQVRALLRDGDPPAISMRERHLAAALDAWDRLPDAERTGALRDQTPKGVARATAAAAASVTTMRRGRGARSQGWMLAAAAGLVVVLGAGIVLNSLSGGDDDQSAGSQTAATIGDGQSADQTEERAATAAAEDLGELATAGPLEAPTATGAPAGDVGDAPPPEDDVIALTTPAELAGFAVAALGATSSPSVPETQSPAATEAPADAEAGLEIPQCPGIDIIVGPAQYRGVLVVVGIDLDDNLAIAHRIEDCVEVARADLP